MFIFSISFLTISTVLLTSKLLQPYFSARITPDQTSRETVIRYNGKYSKEDTLKRENNHYANVHIRCNSRRNSSEIHHIGFLKVRKAGGTTLQNIFFRFGLKRNLTFVLPKNSNYFNVAATLPIKPGVHYDILATHSWYNKGHYDKILPEDKVNIAILREPIDRLISSAYYYRDVFNYGYLRKVPKTNYIQELILHPEKYEKGSFSETRNSMGQDFGFEATIKVSDTDKVLKKLNSLENEFFLVLITNRFDESLVLMRRYLNWNLSDILYISRNTHKHQPVNITEELREKYRNTSFMDFALYDHFAKIFDDKVNAEGLDFQKEVKALQDVLKKTISFCEHDKINNTFLEIPVSPWNDAFKVFDSDCKLMQKGENSFIAELKVRHKRMNDNQRH